MVVVNPGSKAVETTETEIVSPRTEAAASSKTETVSLGPIEAISPGAVSALIPGSVVCNPELAVQLGFLGELCRPQPVEYSPQPVAYSSELIVLLRLLVKL